MAFWALGKVKNLSQKLKIQQYKQYGSKIIKNYMNNENDNEQFFDFAQNKPSSSNFNQKLSTNNKQNLSQAEWLEIQMHQYKKLSKLQQKILKSHQQQQEQRLAQQYAQLQRQLQELSKQEELETQEIEKQKLKAQIKMGQKNITELIKENISMREQIEKRKYTQ